MAATVSTQLAPSHHQATTVPSAVGPSSSTFSKEMPTTTLSKYQEQHQQQISTSSSISSLFERVTNFRRSLIKSNQHKKKDKSRSPSGSFSLFNSKSLSPSSIAIETTTETTSKCPIIKNCVIEDNKTMLTTLLSSSNTTGDGDDIADRSVDTNHGDQFRLPTLSHNSTKVYQQEPTMLIHVDEEDAIYGFTSINLNNPARSRQLKQPASTSTTRTSVVSTLTSTSSSLSSSSSTASSSRMIRQANHNEQSHHHKMFASSSCISLYETIDEYCEPSPTTKMDKNKILIMNNNSNNHQKTTYTKYFNTMALQNSSETSFSKHHQQSSCSDWKHSRRSSASILLFGTTNTSAEKELFQQTTETVINDHSQILSPHQRHNQRQMQQPQHVDASRPESTQTLLPPFTPTSHHFRTCSQSSNQYPQRHSCYSLMACHRSSDDILMMSSLFSSNQNSYTTHAANSNQKNWKIKCCGGENSISTNGKTPKSQRIYENINNHQNNHNDKNTHPRHGHNHHLFPDPSRKLTKDSGYESSSSTLISLATSSSFNNGSLVTASVTTTTTTTTTANPNQHSSMMNMMISTSGYGMLNTNHNYVGSTNVSNHSHVVNMDHSRSDSIDSNLSHKSFDSPSSMNSSNHLVMMMSTTNITGHSSSSVPSSTPESHLEDEDPEDENSPPPTPPIRYSSLPENYRHRSKFPAIKSSPRIYDKNDDGDVSWVYESNQLCSHYEKLLPVDSFLQKDSSSWPYNLYPKMKRKKQQLQQHQLKLNGNQIEEKPYDNQIDMATTVTPSSSQSSKASNLYSMSSSSCGYASIPTVTQIVRSHPVQPVTRQETNSFLNRSLSPKINAKPSAELHPHGHEDLSPSSFFSKSSPPMLPPKNQSYSSQNIKEIQKRAVYEFYLRQKEKKNRNKKTRKDEEEINRKPSSYKSKICASNNIPIQIQNCLQSIVESSSTIDVPAGRESNKEISNIHKHKYDSKIVVMKDYEDGDDSLLPLPPPPSDKVILVETEEMLTLPIPSPPSTITTSNELSSLSLEKEKESPPSIDFPPPPPLFVESSNECDPDLNNSNQSSLIINLFEQRFNLDLKNFWPSVDFSQIIPMLMVMFNNNTTCGDNDDDDDELTLYNLQQQLEEETTIEEELIRIDQTRRWKNRVISQRNLLRMEQIRIENDLEIMKTKVGHFLCQKLGHLDLNQKNKLDLLCADMVRIIHLIFSIHRQLNECNGIGHCSVGENGCKNQKEEECGDLQKEEKKQRSIRLKKQLDEARQLRDVIEQRCFMFIERIKRRFGQWSFEQLLNMTIDDDNVHHDHNGHYDIILKMFNDYQDQLPHSQTEKEEQRNNPNGENMNLAKMSRWYLDRLEMLTIQQQLVDFLINQQEEI